MAAFPFQVIQYFFLRISGKYNVFCYGKMTLHKFFHQPAIGQTTKEHYKVLLQKRQDL